MFTVQYRCQFREYWYEAPAGDWVDWPTAYAVAVTLLQSGRRVRILDAYGRVVWSR